MSVAQDDREAAIAVVLAFFDLVDAGRAAETARLFTSDASITFGPGSPAPGTIAGPQISAAMAARQQQAGVTTRHVVSNLLVTAEADGGLRCRSLLTLYRSDDGTFSPQPRTIADIDDHLVRVAGEWRIARRTIQPIFGLAS